MTSVSTESDASTASAARRPALEILLAMANAAHQQANADNAVANDHHRGENRVAREAGFFRTGRKHDRDDQRDLDHGDGHRQDQGAERFADAVRDQFRMLHGSEDRRDQDNGGKRGQRRTQAGRECGSQHGKAQDGEHPCPPRHPQRVRSGHLGLS